MIEIGCPLKVPLQNRTSGQNGSVETHQTGVSLQLLKTILIATMGYH